LLLFRLAEIAGELDVDALARRIPARLVFEWGAYLRWKSGDTGKGKMITDPKDAFAQAAQRWGSR
jgi:hypothetical protein